MFPILAETANELVSVLKRNAVNEDVIEVKEVLSRFMMDIISSCAFGIQSNTLRNPDSEFRKVGKSIIEPSLLNSIRSFIFMIPKLAKLFKVIKLYKFKAFD